MSIEELEKLTILNLDHQFPSGFTQTELNNILNSNFPDIKGFDFGECLPHIYTISGGQRYYVYDSLAVFRHLKELLF